MGILDILTVSLIAVGAAILSFSASSTRRIIRITSQTSVGRYWKILLNLMIFFSLSYLVAIRLIFIEEMGFLIMLTGLVFCFGAGFVYVVVRLGYHSILSLKNEVDHKTSELKNSYQELKKSDDKNKAILRAIPDSMFMLDNLGKCIDLKLSDFTEGEKIRKTFKNKNIYEIDVKTELEHSLLTSQRIIHTHYLSKIHTLAHKKLLHFEYRLKFKNRFKDFESRSVMLSRKKVLCIVRDITEIKNLERELVKGKDSALKEAKLKSDFLANMSHEIRTPMNAVLGMTSLLLQEELEPRQLEYLRLIESSGSTLLHLINDILDFSKIQAGEMAIEKIPFHLDNLIHSIVKSMRIICNNKNISLEAELPSGFHPNLLGDPHRLKQILMNLINNAIKFTHENGNIKVKLEEMHEGFSEEGNSTVRVSVIDSGIGIPEDKQNMIFEQFTQSDMSTTRRYGGTGLGLSICKRLIKLMGGKMGVESPVYNRDKNPGTKFWFEVSFEQAEEVPHNHGTDEGNKSEAADICFFSEPDFVPEYILSYCSKLNLKSHFITNVGSVKKHSPDIIFIDIAYRGDSGFALAKEIKDIYPHFKFIMFTKTGIPGDAKKTLEAGADAYISLPVEFQVFKEIIQETIQKDPSIKDYPLITKHSVVENEMEVENLKVLVAEDNEINQVLIKTMLEKNGCDVKLVSDGEQAIESARKGKFGMIFMDITMPIKDGYEASLDIREFDTATPIIAVTAHALPEYKTKCLDAGMNEVLLKPFQVKDIKDILHQWGKLSSLT